MDLPARAPLRDPIGRRRHVACRCTDNPVRRLARSARGVPLERRRSARDPVDGDVVDLYDLSALAAARPRHDHVSLRARVRWRSGHAAVLRRRDCVRQADGLDVGERRRAFRGGAVFVGPRLHLLEPRRRAGRRAGGGIVRASDAGIRHRARVAGPTRQARAGVPHDPRIRDRGGLVRHQPRPRRPTDNQAGARPYLSS